MLQLSGELAFCNDFHYFDDPRPRKLAELQFLITISETFTNPLGSPSFKRFNV